MSKDAKAAPAAEAAHGGVQSMVQLVQKQQKYVLEIHRTENKYAVDPVPVANGDYIVRIHRGRKAIVPQAIIDVLKDAVSERIDPRTFERTKFHNYPYTAVKYDGPLPLGTEVDENGEAVAAPVPAFN